MGPLFILAQGLKILKIIALKSLSILYLIVVRPFRIAFRICNILILIFKSMLRLIRLSFKVLYESIIFLRFSLLLCSIISIILALIIINKYYWPYRSRLSI